MNEEVDLIRQRMKTPRAAAGAGIVFSVLVMTSFLLVRISVPANPVSDRRALSNMRTLSLSL